MRNPVLRYGMGCGLVLLVLVSGCGGHTQVVNVAAAPDQRVNVEMKASNFAFDPGVIVARKGDTLVLDVTNISGEKHNITVKDPRGKIIKSADLPSHQAVTLEIPLDTAGVYPFYCDVDLHSTMGMKGKIEVK
jgi:plastocyanin